MDYNTSNNNIPRKSFSKLPSVLEIKDLIEIQKRSYDDFLLMDVEPEKRGNRGLNGIFKSVFPIYDYNRCSYIDFRSYRFEKPKYDVEECRRWGLIYSAPLKITVTLWIREIKDKEEGVFEVKNAKEQEVYFGDIPLMTENGTFIFNGTERVVVSQLHRSPGVFFERETGKSSSSGKGVFRARIVPNRGSWLDFEFDSKDRIFVRIDKKRKIPLTIFLRALGYTTEDMFDTFYAKDKIILSPENNSFFLEVDDPERLVGFKTSFDIKSPVTNKVIIKKGQKITRSTLGRIKELIDPKTQRIRLQITKEDIIGDISGKDDTRKARICSKDIVDLNTGEVILECNDDITESKLDELIKRGIKEFEVIYVDTVMVGSSIIDTLRSDGISKLVSEWGEEHARREAIKEIYRRLRPGEAVFYESAEQYLRSLFFNPERYDLSKVGRMKINHKLKITKTPLEHTTLTEEDILLTAKYLIDLRKGIGTIDDIDHLGNRRIRSVGELLENQIRMGMMRMERAIKEKMSLSEIETLMPHDIINPKQVMVAIKDFFGSSQFSQFLDQTNPLSELNHKRRLSVLGPGGLTRERAGFEVRDVHSTHYGRICPIETPEGQNIGLIASLSTLAKVNEFGFIVTPYRKVENQRVTNKIVYYSALEEENEIIAQANAPIDEDGNFLNDYISVRKKGEFSIVPKEEVTLMDVSPVQLVSVASSLIPFLEHDDANRALMGSNMQRQAVPLMRCEAPLVGTNMEGIVAKESGAVVLAKREGIVEYVDATKIVIQATESGDDILNHQDIYFLTKFKKSNQNTCINQKPIVRKGQKVKAGDVIADGCATDRGELALGQNVVVAFMPLWGYNFEDSIVISERLVKEDRFTSIHIEEFEVSARDTKIGMEEITRDIPNAGEEALANLDENGIIRIGAEVKPDDILVGKITPKGETQLTPEENLLRAIFGEKAANVLDTSLRVPPGVYGKVIYTQVFSREEVEPGKETPLLSEELKKLNMAKEDELKGLEQSARRKLKKILVGKISGGKIIDKATGTILLSKGKPYTEEFIDKLHIRNWKNILVEKGEEIEREIEILTEYISKRAEEIKSYYDNKIKKAARGGELPLGVIKTVKVYVATKRNLKVGDKMAGRHGNKGVISNILPEEDMPYLPDGTPVDMVLNPLGVPSRMNLGQILETHIGWASHLIGQRIREMLEQLYSVNHLTSYVRKIYKNNREILDHIDSLSEDEKVDFFKGLTKGIPVGCSVFDGATEDEIKEMLELAGVDSTGKTILFDGRTGDPFLNKVTVGILYMMKLHHLVEDKIHARSTGSYSVVTQQPLGGRAQFGGQRLGEMEVWALESYGAAYTLQEFLTVKSDDVSGRNLMYASIVKGENTLRSSIPESFKVLIKELQGLGLNVEMIQETTQQK